MSTDEVKERLEFETVLKIRCMYCTMEMGEMDGKGVDGETGSICRKCWAEHFPDVPYPEGDS